MHSLDNLTDADLRLLDFCLDMWHIMVRDGKPEFAPGPDAAEIEQEKKLHEGIRKMLGSSRKHD